MFLQTTIQAQGALLDTKKRALENTELLYKVTDCVAPKEGIIFIPGVASTNRDFMEVVNYLQQRNRQDVEIAIFRHKGLIKGEGYFESIEENVEAFVHSISSLPFRKVTLVGHSYGGALALGLANFLKLMGYQVELVMLDTYFEQHNLAHSNKEGTTRLTNLDEVDIAPHLKLLYRHQSRLFEMCQPSVDVELAIRGVFARQSPFSLAQYMEYLEDKNLAQNMNCVSVDGNHFSMLKGKSAKLISEIISEATASKDI